jgi:hypothetical protein
MWGTLKIHPANGIVPDGQWNDPFHQSQPLTENNPRARTTLPRKFFSGKDRICSLEFYTHPIFKTPSLRNPHLVVPYFADTFEKVRNRPRGVA